MPRLRAVTSAQKVALDAIYQRYLKSVGQSANLELSLHWLVRYCLVFVVGEKTKQNKTKTLLLLR